jgi:hypothetical protein
MQQLIPGVFHWNAPNASIATHASSYYVESAKAIIDPRIPAEGLAALPGEPAQILLSSGHHLRDAIEISETLQIPIRASRAARAHLGAADAGHITAWEDGAGEVALGITAIAVGVLASDEGALHIDSGPGALLVADAVTHTDAGLAFFPDPLLGDDPEGIKEGLQAAFRAILSAFTFDALLFAHGEPMAAGGHAALEEFLGRGAART